MQSTYHVMDSFVIIKMFFFLAYEYDNLKVCYYFEYYFTCLLLFRQLQCSRLEIGNKLFPVLFRARLYQSTVVHADTEEGRAEVCLYGSGCLPGARAEETI